MRLTPGRGVRNWEDDFPSDLCVLYLSYLSFPFSSL